MYLKFFVLSILVMATSSTWADSANPATRTTNIGAIFTKVERVGFGEAWADPSGMIWGDVVTDNKGIVLNLVWQEAIVFCQKIGGEFPSREDFIRLREYMGSEKNSTRGYSPQILPHLSNSMFWSESYGSELAYVFFGSTGFVLDYDISYNYAMNFRCVTR